MDHELRAWLGPAHDEMAPDQLDRVARESDLVNARYPKPDDAEYRAAALSAAVQYILGEMTVADAGAARIRARREERLSSVVSQQVAAMAVADGMTEVDAARAAVIDRMTVRRALGKL